MEVIDKLEKNFLDRVVAVVVGGGGGGWEGLI